MRHYIFTLGRTKTILAFTLLAFLLTTIFTQLFCWILRLNGFPANHLSAAIISSSVALIITPLMSWYVIGLVLDIHKLEQEMRSLASYDFLTGLLCRRVFLERADYFHKVSKRKGLIYSVIMADIDSLKKINDHNGHIVGDKVLESFGNSIRLTNRESDLACRYGGDEFLFFLPNTTTEQAQVFAERIQALIREPLEYDGKLFQNTASLGIASYSNVSAESVEDIIKAADNALYQAKQLGGNQIQNISSDQGN